MPGPAGNGWMAKGRVVLGYNWLAPLVPCDMGRPPVYHQGQA